MVDTFPRTHWVNWLSARHDEVVFTPQLLSADLLGADILELQLFGNALDDFDFLAYGVDKVEACIGEEDGERNAGKTAAGAHVEYFGHGFERLHLGDGEAVEDMVLIEVVHVFARDDVDF